VQYAPARHSDLPDVPAVVELGKTPEANQILGFYSSSAELGRSVVAPPGVPSDRIKVLRSAFDAMLKDPELRAEIDKSQLEFHPASGDEVQKLVSDTANVAKDIAEQTKAILRAR
jgi:tripartite-type tricarboxylate transporter receptor subunit TctC